MVEESYRGGGFVEFCLWNEWTLRSLHALMKLKWIGIDCGSADHPMNTSIRYKRPDLAREYERKMKKSIDEIFKEEDYFIMHKMPFPQGIPHAENVGGDIEQVLNRRCVIGAFPWKFVGGEARICRIVAFLKVEVSFFGSRLPQRLTLAKKSSVKPARPSKALRLFCRGRH